jgi:hypothetical protein
MSITITWQPAMITADHFQTSNHPSKEPQLCPPAIRPSHAPSISRRRPAMIIAFIPIGAIVGFLGGLLIEIIVGLIAGTVFNADHPARFSWRFLGSLPGLGALIGAMLAPILYARARRS